MKQTLEANAATEAKSSALADALQESGHVAIYGITSDFNTATLRREAAPVLGQVLALLPDDAKLSLEIDGHTNSIGQPPYNWKLSADRAWHRRCAPDDGRLRRHESGCRQRGGGRPGEEPARRAGAALISGCQRRMPCLPAWHASLDC